MKLKKKMMLFIAFPIILTFVLSSLTSYFYSNRILVNDAKEAMLHQAKKAASDIETVLAKKTAYVEIAANAMEKNVHDRDKMLHDLKYLTENVEGTLGFFLALPDKTFLDGTGWIPDADFDPTRRVWYTKAMENSGVSLSPPYLRIYDNSVIMSLSTKVMAGNEVYGILGSDVSLNELDEIISEIRIKETGKAFIISKDGSIIIHPELQLNDLISSLDSKLSDLILSSDSGTFRHKFSGVDKLYAKHGISNSDWILVVDAPIGEVTAASKDLALVMSLIALISLVILVIFIYFVTQKFVVKPILMLTSCIEGMVDYDFTLTEKSPSVIFSKNKDEIGIISRALIKVKNTIKDIIININDIANQVSAASEELTASSDQSASLAEGVAQAVNDITNGVALQADNMSEGNEAMNVMSHALNENERIIEALNNETKSVLVAKENGINTIAQLVETTETSKNATSKIYGVIIGTNEKAIAISAASDMIKSIADQTNLLALNAAIEAARAGEAGKGFAVVAEEIRKLAEQSNSFTEEIKDIVTDLNSKTSEAVSIIANVGEIVNDQFQKVVETREQFEIISDAIESNRVEIDKLNSSKEKLENIKSSLINVIHILSEVSSKNSDSAMIAAESTTRQTASSQEVASASLNLATMSQEMIEMISKFSV